MKTFEIILLFIIATLFGMWYIKYAINLPDKDKKWKWQFIMMGSFMIICGMVLVLIHIAKHKV